MKRKEEACWKLVSEKGARDGGRNSSRQATVNFYAAASVLGACTAAVPPQVGTWPHVFFHG